MEQIHNSLSKPSALYLLAKQITQTSNDTEKENLYEKLGEMVQRIFMNDKTHEIEDALSIAAENEEVEVMGIIMDDAEIEISHVEFDLGDRKLDSSMLLLSCAMITKQEKVTLPSIGRMEEVIQRHLVNAGVISDASQFRLGAVRIDNNSIEDLHLNEWWRVHRNIIEDMDTVENDEKLQVETEIEVDVGVGMFHLVPVIISEDDEDVTANLFDEDMDTDVWDEISKELSSENLGLKVLPPNFISTGITESQYILQTAQLQLMLSEYKKYENIDIGYIQTNSEGAYVVFMLDNEDLTLVDFYIFETDGNETDLISMLVNEAQEFNSQKIWHFDVVIDLDDIEEWYDEKAVYLDSIMKHGHEIDIKQYLNFVSGGSSTQYLH